MYYLPLNQMARQSVDADQPAALGDARYRDNVAGTDAKKLRPTFRYPRQLGQIVNSTRLIWPVRLNALVLGVMPVFYVGESEKEIKFRLGKIVKSNYRPGLHFTIPFINNVSAFDARLLTLNAKSERFLTLEKKNVIVEPFCKMAHRQCGVNSVYALSRICCRRIVSAWSRY